MSPITHLFASWVIAAKGTDNLRDCRLVTLAGIAPDADGLPVVLDIFNDMFGRPDLHYYATYHHFLLHGLAAGVGMALLAACLARQRWRVFFLCLVVFHLHLVCDLAGSRGPDPWDLWPVFYLGPFSKEPMWVWKWQWPLDSWPNRLVSVALFGWILVLAVRLGHSIVSMFSPKLDRVVVGVLRGWVRGR